LRIVNETLLLDRGESIATAFVGTIAPDSRTLRYASAGHPPAFLCGKDAALLEISGSSPPLGIQSGLTFDTGSIVIDKPAMLVMYTDGVTEATRDAIAGERTLRAVLGSDALNFAANPARFVERTVGRNPSQDDVAIMTVRFGARKTLWHWDVANPAAAYAIKGSVLAALREIADFTVEQEQNLHMIFGELVGNAVRHAPGALSIAISAADGKVCLHVIDEGPGFEQRPGLPSDIWSESGRGLYLISALAEDLTVERLAGFGSYVIVELQHQARKTRKLDERSLVESISLKS
jgi:anti-sigma regulatory factor (Ser/Thr protein kinase)